MLAQLCASGGSRWVDAKGPRINYLYKYRVILRERAPKRSFGRDQRIYLAHEEILQSLGLPQDD